MDKNSVNLKGSGFIRVTNTDTKRKELIAVDRIVRILPKANQSDRKTMIMYHGGIDSKGSIALAIDEDEVDVISAVRFINETLNWTDFDKQTGFGRGYMVLLEGKVK
jgi:hypothetical protein